MLPVDIASIISMNNDVQKLKQKSQLNNCEISFGALSIIAFLTPNLSIRSIANADANVTKTSKNKNVIKYISGIALLLLT